MKKILSISLFTLFAFCTTAFAHVNTIWKELNNTRIPVKGERTLFPTAYKVFQLNDAYLRNLLFQLPEGGDGAIISLPAPDGTMESYRIKQTPVMPHELAAKYPEIKNFTAVSINNPAITAKVNYTYAGFNAMIYNNGNSYFIDPYTNSNEGLYICYYKKDFPKNPSYTSSCGTIDDAEKELGEAEQITTESEPRPAFKTNGSLKKTFRLALACTGEYAQAVSGAITPTKPIVLSAMTTTLARVNGILERELSITLQLIPNNDTLIYLDPATDSFTSTQNSSINGATQTANQTNCDKVIGSSNYDIGHLFCSGDGGIADLRGLCDPGEHARGVTGKANPTGDAFDVDYVVHEIGHQLGAQHTFNYTGSGCGSHAVSSSAYEPGSGSTIMAYAGLCAGNDMQMHSDDYFHARSLHQISEYISTTDINTCGTTTPLLNDIPVVADIAASYQVPVGTPFELQAPAATDIVHDAITYCWEQYDLGDFGYGLNFTELGPIIRSFRPDTSRWRIFPVLDSIKSGVNSYRSEKMPVVTRTLNFRLTVRDISNGFGAYNWSDTTVTLYSTSTAGPFKINGLDSSDIRWRNGSTHVVKWDVANTTAAPVSCSNVDIFLSIDDGITWPYLLASNTPNDGAEPVTVPMTVPTAGARIKVKSAGNVFFDINDAPFKINNWPDDVPQNLITRAGLDVYPIPARDVLHIATDANIYHATMFNSIGQQVWAAAIDGVTNIETYVNIAGFSSGIYYIHFLNTATGEKLLKKVIIL